MSLPWIESQVVIPAAAFTKPLQMSSLVMCEELLIATVKDVQGAQKYTKADEHIYS